MGKYGSLFTNFKGSIVSRKRPCSLCGNSARLMFPIIRKPNELLTAERLRSAKKNSRGVRRVCEKCWFLYAVEMCSKEEIAAAFILYCSISEGNSEGWGRNFEECLAKKVEQLKH